MEDEQVIRIFEDLLKEKLNPLLAKIDDLMLKHSALQEKYDVLMVRHSELKDSFDNQLSEAVKEIELRTRKANNIIISGIQEPQNGTVTERAASDTDKCFDILNFLDVKDRNAIKAVSRIGKPRKDGKRLLRVEFHDFSWKLATLRNAKRLRTSAWRDVYINPDRTQLQQAEEKQLREELSERRAKGEQVYIYRGKIVSKSPSQNFH